FIVSDEGNLYEIRTNGSLIRTEFMGQEDLEGITVNPTTGFLYAAVEGEDTIIEIDPSSFKLTRKFLINRNFEGRELLKTGGMGLEAIVFIPNPLHPEGGVFWIGNQSFSLKPNREPSVICEIVIPINSRDMKKEGEITGFFPSKIIDISGLDYDTSRECLIVVSDTTNLLMEIKLNGDILHQYLLPGSDQEGIALDDLGFVYIAQENGQIIKIEDYRN
ncbi:MAG: SdiA-regulated domain-containing protein, partial [Candidatus Poribacteria bacterium]|nr:SdiA-regulated domain-containing protein [Candidatus Poribacteria bacterium]